MTTVVVAGGAELWDLLASPPSMSGSSLTGVLLELVLLAALTRDNALAAESVWDCLSLCKLSISGLAGCLLEWRLIDAASAVCEGWSRGSI